MIKSLKPGKKLLNIDEYECYCDGCGNLCKKQNGEEGWEYIEINHLFGYGGKKSKKNHKRYKAHICEKCFDEKLSFIKFEISNGLPFYKRIFK